MPSRITLAFPETGARVPCAVREYRQIDAGLAGALSGRADVPTVIW